MFFEIFFMMIDRGHSSGYETSTKAISTTTNLPTKSWDYGVPSEPNTPEETDNRVNAATYIKPYCLYIFASFVIQYTLRL